MRAAFNGAACVEFSDTKFGGGTPEERVEPLHSLGLSAKTNVTYSLASSFGGGDDFLSRFC